MGLALIIPGISFAGANIGKVTPAADIPITGLAISGLSSVTGDVEAAQYVAEYTPANTSQRAVIWSIVSGSAYASINSDGVLTVLQGASSASVTIRVTSQVDNSIYADKAITVTYESQILPEGAIQAELLYSTGYTSFIDTNLVPSGAMSFEAEVVWVKSANAYCSFFGYNISNTRFAVHRSSGGVNEIGYGAVHTGSWPTTNYKCQRTKLRVVMTGSGATIETYAPDGTLLNTDEISYTASPSFTQTIGLLGRKTSATGIDSGCWRGGLGRVTFYGDDHFGTPAADYIPCYYQDNFGFWDAVGEEFLIGNVPENIYGFGAYWGTQGFAPNVRNDSGQTSSEYLIDYRGGDATRMFEIPSGCANIRFNAGEVDSNNKALMFFDENRAYVGYYSANAADREVTIPSGSVYVRLSYSRENKASAYIYDMDGGAYIWNGGA